MRIVSLWPLDFDACSPITMNNAGVRKAVKAFLETEPYCPRPYSQDEYARNLWRVFSQRYIATGQKIAAATAWQNVPARFIQSIMDELSYLDKSTQPEKSQRGQTPQMTQQGSSMAGQGQAGQQARGGTFGRRRGRQVEKGIKTSGGGRGGEKA